MFALLRGVFFFMLTVTLALGEEKSPLITDYCKKIQDSFVQYNWGDSECNSLSWIHVRTSVKGSPLAWIVVGNETEALAQNYDTTMIMCGVHGDEITPIKFCFDVLKQLRSNSKDYLDKKKLIVVVPLVNPDSYFAQRPTRTNARGVDVNRNFPTNDWNSKALKLWRSETGSNSRRFPGHRPLSEPETLFQVNLIKRYQPDKIISVHAPLTFIDYDGPMILQQGPVHPDGLTKQMGEMAGGYKVKNFPFFPGSLGNWAGHERHIPTYTLELPSSDPSKSSIYWEQFKEAIHFAITSDLRPPPKS